ncbi:acetoacetate--CoA ligase [Haliea sp.]|jgi:acetoacetyl-CoA synthetase|uniref:acetoacetate--CoA ligase n=1 Tax=Haliea TaxID=475794 RepID=UPI000C40CDF6|nr:acetoacetate--CoA ligase [Haliea sp.]MAY92583.1 acetoacetate--CoA ligase [Haliea sp.]MBK39581.1 acetoacetate--CoA ligase [Haliea sp.]MBP70784.1 acetoacetate--CoA ligase [Haliea sp.]|tara:strand:+ start:19683 stop:21635 length:1953 start_codon:yes stop_codon:yes gene_type:complete
MSEEPLWKPSPERCASAQFTCFAAGLAARGHVPDGADYFAVHDWAVAEPASFWREVWDFTGVVGEPGTQVLEAPDQFPGARWFPEARLNFAENLLQRRDDHPALVSLLETGARRELTYADLYRQVAGLAAALRALGVGSGDRVAGLLPNVPEAVIAMLATSSLGAIWTSCSPDFGVNGIIDRFGQVAPKVLFCADGYYYNGKACAVLDRLDDILPAVGSVEQLVVVPLLTAQPALPQGAPAVLFADFIDPAASAIEFSRLPFNHPLYVMYSSGTTGAPKCILHGAGGTLLQHRKEHSLMCDIGPHDVFFYYTTCGWMMWNWLASGLASGATLVLYDGSPFAGEGRLLLDAIDAEGITVFGTSAKYIAALEKAGERPAHSHDLRSLKTILSTGSPLLHENYEYVYRDFKRDVCLSSISGGTDILSCFVGGSSTLPVHAGEIQAPGLGMAVAIWNDQGCPVQEQKGELVCTAPFPSCPLGFWNDPDGSRFHAAYFARFDGVWAQGDYGEETANRGFIIHGRSDAVLNPGGVRIGTAEIYRQVEQCGAVLESVVIGQQWQGDVRVVLFVVLRAGCTLDAALEAEIRGLIRRNTTPRHVPARIVQVADIPRTLSGKIVELAVRNVVHGEPVKNTDALANPEALRLFRNLPSLQS